MNDEKIDTIVILSGGSSSRFKPLSHKNLLRFNGVPLIEYQFSRYRTYTDNLVVVTNKETENAVALYAEKYHAKLIVQEGSGQAAAVLSAKSLLKGQTVIVNGNDLYYDSLFVELLKRRQETGADGFFVSVIPKEYIPGGYLILKDSHIAGVIEKPAPNALPSPYYKLVVDYIKDIEVFIQTLESTRQDGDDAYEIALTSYIKSGKTFKNVVYKNNWATMKYAWHVLDAMSFFLKEIKPHVGHDSVIDPSAKIIGDVHIDDGVTVHEFSKIIGPCYIGKNAIIGNFALVNQSMIGEKSVIGGYSEVTRSYVGDNVWTHRAYVGDSVIEGDANFAAGSVTANSRFDKTQVHCRVKGEKVDTLRKKLGLIAGRNIQLGVNAATMPGVMLQSGSIIHAGEICGRDA